VLGFAEIEGSTGEPDGTCETDGKLEGSALLLGDEEGTIEGVVLGLAEGRLDGAELGFKEGPSSRPIEGSDDSDGLVDGVAEGLELGIPEGFSEGAADTEGLEEGASEGLEEGAKEGALEGAAESVGAADGTSFAEGGDDTEGFDDGTADGALEGLSDGAAESVGAADGASFAEGGADTEGFDDGTADGALEGLSDGAAESVGVINGAVDTEGLADGTADGAADGSSLGAAEGVADGALEGAGEGHTLPLPAEHNPSKKMQQSAGLPSAAKGLGRFRHSSSSRGVVHVGHVMAVPSMQPLLSSFTIQQDAPLAGVTTSTHLSTATLAQLHPTSVGLHVIELLFQLQQGPSSAFCRPVHSTSFTRSTHLGSRRHALLGSVQEPELVSNSQQPRPGVIKTLHSSAELARSHAQILLGTHWRPFQKQQAALFSAGRGGYTSHVSTLRALQGPPPTGSMFG
jgi:hypothetical protein